MEQIKKLIKQLKKDKNVLENMIGYERVIYIGFIGNGKINNNIFGILKNIKALNLIILQIKKCNWLERKLTQNIDWETYSLFQKIKNENDILHNENALLKEQVELLNTKLDILSKLVENHLGIKNEQFLGKKIGGK